MFSRVFRPYVYLRFISTIESLALITSLFIHLFFSYVIILCATSVCIFSTKLHIYTYIYIRKIQLVSNIFTQVACFTCSQCVEHTTRLVDSTFGRLAAYCVTGARFFAFLEIKPWAAFNQNIGFMCIASGTIPACGYVLKINCVSLRLIRTPFYTSYTICFRSQIGKFLTIITYY